MRTSGRLASIGLAFALITGVAECVISQTVNPAQALAALQDTILSKGTNSEEPTPASSVKTEPTFVALPAVPVTKENILAAWKQVHGVGAPNVVKKVLQ